MNVIVNNQRLNVEAQNLMELVEELPIEAQGIAIAQNGQVIPRSDWEQSTLAEDDKVVIVSAVFGG